jgi:branched-chain amino acid transport system permease protein
MTRLIETLIGGITAGSVYALLAICLTLVFKVTDLLNLATGSLAALGALAVIDLTGTFGLALIPAIAIVLAASFLVGTALHRLALDRFLQRRQRGVAMLVTLGVGLLLEGIGQLRWGVNFYGLRSFSGNAPLRLGDLAIPSQTLWVVGAAILVSVALWLVFQRTYIGKVFLSCSENPAAASLLGIDTRLIATGAFGIGAALAALAGILVAPITFMSYDSGTSLLLFGFIAAAVAGMDNVFGALLGGLSVGVVGSLVAGYVSTDNETAIVFVLLLLILAFRPHGLVGDRAGAYERA